MRPAVSVVIPLYNKAATIARAIDSAIRQEAVEVEVVVVDDGSSDGSPEIAARYGKRITLVRQPNAGPSAARNRGVAVSRHPVVAFLDADDEYLPGCLAAHMHCRQHDSGALVSLVSFRHIARDGTQQDEVLKNRIFGATQAGSVRVPDFRAALAINVHIGCLAVDKPLFDACGGFDERLVSWEITDFMLRLLLRTPQTVLLDGIYLNVHETPGSQSTLTHGAPRYVGIFAEKMIDLIENVPPTERTLLARQLTGFLRALWMSGAVREFKRLTMKATPVLREHGYGGKLLLAARLPEFALRTVRQRPRFGRA
jgi:glycosyltransferase involved in cell wall biosynthesis